MTKYSDIRTVDAEVPPRRGISKNGFLDGGLIKEGLLGEGADINFEPESTDNYNCKITHTKSKHDTKTKNATNYVKIILLLNSNSYMRGH